MWSTSPCGQWDPWTPSSGKIHGGIPLCLQHFEDSRPIGVISILSDGKHTIICMDNMYRDAVAAEAAAAAVPAKENKGKKKYSRDTSKESGRSTSSECVAPVDDLPESSNSKRSKVAAPHVKKVPVRLAGVDGTFTINAR